jgi:hypothetical protein
VKHFALLSALTLLAPLSLLAAEPQPANPAPLAASDKSQTQYAYLDRPHPFTRVSVELGASSLGPQIQLATNLSNHLNIRGIGSYINYDIGDFSDNGITFSPSLTLKSAAGAIDYYPFLNHGLRFSAGAVFYNQNGLTTTFNVPSGQTFTMNDESFYVAQTVTGVGGLTLNKNNPAILVSTGWGNMIPRKKGHWSFPLELGVVMTGKPALNLAFTGGYVCDNSTSACVTPVSVTSDPTVQSALNAQISKYTSDLDPLRYYPMVSFGVAYSFKIR